MQVSCTRLYASSIAVVSGVYALLSASGMTGVGLPVDRGGVGVVGWIMFALGVVVLIHGIMLLTAAASRIGSASGPLMLVWAVVMLLTQALGAGMPGLAMPGFAGGMRGGMGWDAGMLAIAVLMLVSGLIMMRPGSSRREM